MREALCAAQYSPAQYSPVKYRPRQFKPSQFKPRQQELLKRDSLIHNGPHPARSVVSKEPPNTAIDITERFLSKKGSSDARWDYATTNKCTFFFPKRVMK